MLAGGLDRMLEHDAMTIDLVAELVFEPFDEILRGDGTESFAGFAGFEREGDLQFADAAGQIFRFVQFARFAFGAFRLQIVELPHGARRDFVGFAVRQKKIARITAADFDDISLGAKAGDVFGQNNLSGRHEQIVADKGSARENRQARGAGL